MTQQTARTTEAQIRELARLTTRNEAGQHFTEWSKYWQALEEQGLITIDRPIHGPTGIPYGQEHYNLQVTDAGQDLVDANPELHTWEPYTGEDGKQIQDDPETW